MKAAATPAMSPDAVAAPIASMASTAMAAVPTMAAAMSGAMTTVVVTAAVTVARVAAAAVTAAAAMTVVISRTLAVVTETCNVLTRLQRDPTTPSGGDDCAGVLPSDAAGNSPTTVSYTHLTLPTTPYV